MQQSGDSHGWRIGNEGEEVADVRDGQGDRIVPAGGVVVRISATVGGRAGGDGGQECQGEHDVPVPAGPVADLVMVQADLALGGLVG